MQVNIISFILGLITATVLYTMFIAGIYKIVKNDK